MDTITATEALASARTRHSAAQAAHQAAKTARDTADASRAALISKAAATGDDVSSEMELHRASLGGLADAADLSKAISIESKRQLDSAELDVLIEQASTFEKRWEDVITACLLKAKDADTARAVAQAAMAELDVAQQAVVNLAQQALRHDVSVQDALSNNERLAVLHRSQLPLVGKVMSAEFQHPSLRPSLVLATKHGPEMFPFHHSMTQHFVSQLAGKLPVARFAEILAQLSDTTPAKVVQ
jgi:hypothetical protein